MKIQKSLFVSFGIAIFCLCAALFAGSFWVIYPAAALDAPEVGVYVLEYLDSEDGHAVLDTVNPGTVTEAELPLELAEPTSVATGYAFAYWGFNKYAPLPTNSSDKYYLTMEDILDYAYEGKVQIFAYWDLTEYSVSFSYSGVEYGTVTDATGFAEINNTVTAATVIDLTADAYLPKCAGHQFLGWYSDSVYNTPITTLSNVTSDITLYGAFGRLNYTITFADDTLGLEPIPFRANMDYAYDYNGQKGLLTDINPTRPGYVFCGWYTTEECLEGTHVGKFYLFTTPVTLYAKWEKRPSLLWLYISGGACVLIAGGFAWWYFASKKKLTIV